MLSYVYVSLVLVCGLLSASFDGSLHGLFFGIVGGLLVLRLGELVFG